MVCKDVPRSRAFSLTLVLEPPKLDLDAYIANYKGKAKRATCRVHEYWLIFDPGRARFVRLMLIGSTSTYLYLDALKAAVAEAKRGTDVPRYELAVSTLKEFAPSDPGAVKDLAWIDRTKKQVKVETDKLEVELKGYKNNLIKESIRVRLLSLCQPRISQLTFFYQDGLR